MTRGRRRRADAARSGRRRACAPSPSARWRRRGPRAASTSGPGCAGAGTCAPSCGPPAARSSCTTAETTLRLPAAAEPALRRLLAGEELTVAELGRTGRRAPDARSDDPTGSSWRRRCCGTRSSSPRDRPADRPGAPTPRACAATRSTRPHRRRRGCSWSRCRGRGAAARSATAGSTATPAAGSPSRADVRRRPGAARAPAGPARPAARGRPQGWALVDTRPGRERVRWGTWRARARPARARPGRRPSVSAGPGRPAAAGAGLHARPARRVLRAAGRPVAVALAEARTGWDVWECSHVGGDRFAANVLLCRPASCSARSTRPPPVAARRAPSTRAGSTWPTTAGGAAGRWSSRPPSITLRVALGEDRRGAVRLLHIRGAAAVDGRGRPRRAAARWSRSSRAGPRRRGSPAPRPAPTGCAGSTWRRAWRTPASARPPPPALPRAGQGRGPAPPGAGGAARWPGMRLGGRVQMARTFAACGPFWPCWMSNSTRWFSSSER